MAVEVKRGCGYRKVGGLYLCGSGITISCDRLPFPIEYCPVCGAGIKFTQGFTWLNWQDFAGQHDDCSDEHFTCYLCDPDAHPQPYGLLWVGEAYYSPQSFIKEALEMGVSKRIPFIPKELKLGETIVLLAHKKAIGRFSEEAVWEDKPAIFYAFKPTTIEMPIWKSELNDEKEKELVKRGITPIPIPDGDVDHMEDVKTTIALDPVTKRFSKVVLEE